MENRILSPLEARILPWLVAVAFFMQTLDATILNTALPAMADSLHTNALQMQAVVISYMLTVALLIPASGWMTDRFGIRRVFMAAILVFTLGSLLCALSPSLPLITAARVVQASAAPYSRRWAGSAYSRPTRAKILSRC